MSTNPFRRSSLKGSGGSSPLNIPSAEPRGASPGPLSIDTRGLWFLVICQVDVGLMESYRSSHRCFSETCSLRLSPSDSHIARLIPALARIHETELLLDVSESECLVTRADRLRSSPRQRSLCGRSFRWRG